MGTGLIYAALVLMWAVVLLPMWIRRHDDATEAHSVDRFTTAMRILSRRSDAGSSVGAGGRVDRREVTMLARSTRPDVTVQGRPAPRAGSRTGGRAVHTLASRRRRTLAVVSGLTIIVLGLALLGVIPGFVAAIPVLVLLGFLVHLRAEASRSADRARRLESARIRAERRAARDGVARPQRPAAVVDVRGLAFGPPVEAFPATAVEVGPSLSVAGPGELYDAVAERVWDPIPVPLPTYVTAPKAPRQVRVIDLTTPGAWTSGHLSPEEQAALEHEAVASAREEIVDHAQAEPVAEDARRRAVGD